MLITSFQNPKIKFIEKLEKAKNRAEYGLFVVEGFREIQLALEANYSLFQLFYCEEIIAKDATNSIFKMFSDTDVEMHQLSIELYRKLVYRENKDGLLAVFYTKVNFLSDLILPEKPLLIVVESVEKPGNLGAILRTADAAKVDAVIVCDPLTDLFNPNVIRSSIGCLFTNQVVVASSLEVYEFLKAKKITTYAAALTAKEYYQNKNFKEATAFVMGTEAWGLSSFWLENADEEIKIPMLGKIDSLNVSTSTAVLVFEAKRQRGF